MQHYDTWHLTFSQWCQWEFSSFRLLTLCLCTVGSQHSEGDRNLQNHRNCLHCGTASPSKNIHILTMSSVVSTLGHVSTKVLSTVQEGSTIAQFSNYIRVLEHCTRMWPSAISVIYCQHHECVYKQPWYTRTMLKYGLQTETMTTSNQEREHFFRHIEEKEEGTDHFWYF